MSDVSVRAAGGDSGRGGRGGGGAPGGGQLGSV